MAKTVLVQYGKLNKRLALTTMVGFPGSLSNYRRLISADLGELRNITSTTTTLIVHELNVYFGKSFK